MCLQLRLLFVHLVFFFFSLLVLLCVLSSGLLANIHILRWLGLDCQMILKSAVKKKNNLDQYFSECSVRKMFANDYPMNKTYRSNNLNGSSRRTINASLRPSMRFLTSAFKTTSIKNSVSGPPMIR